MLSDLAFAAFADYPSAANILQPYILFHLFARKHLPVKVELNIQIQNIPFVISAHLLTQMEDEACNKNCIYF